MKFQNMQARSVNWEKTGRVKGECKLRHHPLSRKKTWNSSRWNRSSFKSFGIKHKAIQIEFRLVCYIKKCQNFRRSTFIAFWCLTKSLQGESLWWRIYMLVRIEYYSTSFRGLMKVEFFFKYSFFLQKTNIFDKIFWQKQLVLGAWNYFQ